MDGSAVNVRVAVRCRPLSSKEQARGCASIVEINENKVHISGPSEDKDKQFTFDYAYDPNSLQDQVFHDLGEPMINQALKGYNGTIFAYGQTGSGKTHSMMGNDKDPGIIPRINQYLFEQSEAKLAASQQSPEEGETKIMITVSFLEIYNEVVKDLLNPIGKALNIRESPEKGIYVEGLFELIVHNAGELMGLIQQGNAVRKVAATNMNEQSSRSHSCLTIKVSQRSVQQLTGGVQRERLTKATLNLVDLAGSERASKTGATGATLKEGTNINQSLMTLGVVINKLSEGGKTHIPYRDSKLTRLLQESLGGNSATIMVAAISPADYNFDETLGTLKYANRAKSIANAVTVNEDQTDKMIRNLKEEIEKLREQLLSGTGTSPDPQLQKRLDEAEEAQKNAWEELEIMSRNLQEERKKNMSNVISERMKSIKDEKILRMKNIKRLQNEKAALTKRFKKNKAANVVLKTKLDDEMVAYSELEAKFSQITSEEESERLVEEMQNLLEVIERDRQEWKDRNAELKNDKLRLSEVDDLLTEERGELVATANILEEDDKLRTSIQEEERAKAKLLLDKELEAAKIQLEAERSKLRGSVEAEVSDRIEQLNEEVTELKRQLTAAEGDKDDLHRRNEDFKEYNNELLEQLSDAELDKETVMDERDQALAQVAELEGQLMEAHKSLAEQEEQMQALQKEVQTRVSAAVAEDEKYQLFRSLMDAFEKEREEWRERNSQLQQSLKSATNDILFLSRKNEAVQEALSQAVHWEVDIQPTQYAGAGRRHSSSAGATKS